MNLPFEQFPVQELEGFTVFLNEEMVEFRLDVGNTGPQPPGRCCGRCDEEKNEPEVGLLRLGLFPSFFDQAVPPLFGPGISVPGVRVRDIWLCLGVFHFKSQTTSTK